MLWEAGVPFLVCRTYGLIGYMRLIVKEHTGNNHSFLKQNVFLLAMQCLTCGPTTC